MIPSRKKKKEKGKWAKSHWDGDFENENFPSSVGRGRNAIMFSYLRNGSLDLLVSQLLDPQISLSIS